jgi:hypothetical protein
MSNRSNIVNDGGVFTTSVDFRIRNAGDAGKFVVRNNGKFVKEASETGGMTVIEPQLVLNNGTLDIQGNVEFAAVPGMITEFLGTFNVAGQLRFPNYGARLLPGSVINLNGGQFEALELQMQQLSRITGSGTIAANVFNNGLIDPGIGLQPGTLIIQGRLVLEESSRLHIDLSGPSSSEYDRIQITDIFTLNGRLNIALTEGYTPDFQDVFTFITFRARVLSSNFIFISLPVVSGVEFTLAYHPQDLTLHDVRNPQ